MVRNLSEGTSRWWGILVRGPVCDSCREFDGGDQQVVGSLSEETSIWWGI